MSINRADDMRAMDKRQRRQKKLRKEKSKKKGKSKKISKKDRNYLKNLFKKLEKSPMEKDSTWK